MAYVHIKSNSPTKAKGHTQTVQGGSHIRAHLQDLKQGTVSPNLLETKKVSKMRRQRNWSHLKKREKNP